MSRQTAPVGVLHTTKQAGQIIGICSETVRRLIADGELAGVNIARRPGDVRWRVTDAAIADYVKAHEHARQAPRRSRRARAA